MNKTGKNRISKIQKIAALLFVFILVAPAVLLIKPKKAQALIFHDALNFVVNAITSGQSTITAVSTGGLAAKELIGDPIAHFAAKAMLRSLTGNIKNWIRGGSSGQPLFVTNMDDYLGDLADNAGAIFLEQLLGEEMFDALCSPFRLNVIRTVYFRVPFNLRARCTISDIIENLEDFFDGDFLAGGWYGWRMVLEPQNNPYGLYLMTLEEKEKREYLAVQAGAFQVQMGQGYLGLTNCLEKVKDPTDPSGKREICKKYDITLPGKSVESALSQSMGADLSSLALADEIDEVIVTALDQLMVWAITGGGEQKGIYATTKDSPQYSERSSEDIRNWATTGGYRSPESEAAAKTTQKTFSQTPEGVEEALNEEKAYKEAKYNSKIDIVRTVQALTELGQCDPDKKDSSDAEITLLQAQKDQITKNIEDAEMVLRRLEDILVRSRTGGMTRAAALGEFASAAKTVHSADSAEEELALIRTTLEEKQKELEECQNPTESSATTTPAE